MHVPRKVLPKELRFYVMAAALLAALLDHGFCTLDTAILKAAPSGIGASSSL